MTVIRLKYVHRFKDRYGRVRHYLRKPGCKRAPLPDPADKNFYREYERLLNGLPPEAAKSQTIRSAIPGSLADLICHWRTTHAYKSKEPSTQAVYNRLIKRIEQADYSRAAAATMAPANVRYIMRQFSDSPTTANRILTILNSLMDAAIDLGWRDNNPCFGIKRIRVESEGIHSWTDAEIKAYEARWPSGSKQRLAFALLLYTGQRRSDIVKMGPSDYKEISGQRMISVTQQKTNVKLLIPIHASLQRELDAWIFEGQPTFLLAERGKPYSANGFYNSFSDWCREAGLPTGCSPHGLRKAAGRKLAEAGCTPHQIAAILGHKTLTEVERYTRAADQSLLAIEAMKKMT
ncbi:tyrosine-type recombinase/integrase [Acetobacter cerevisiae]|uniref:Tyrosine-type recombinase/integrase n=2 Tax=Acetobacter cerevisiae TaxID=178900 RepID=A0ABT1ERL5_9PROT|nr:tyrosine-type recombinase/integrase [Acetobacter cerevisiae]MCP1255733.1 tyrosine-type recombinase/integrase [Acetobacter cerevisiae]